MKTQLTFGKDPQLIFSSEKEFYKTLGQICNDNYCTITYENNSDTGSFSDVYRIRILGDIKFLVPGMKKKCKSGQRINCHPYVEYLVSNFGFTRSGSSVSKNPNKVTNSIGFDKSYLKDFQDGYNEVCYSKAYHINLAKKTYNLTSINSAQSKLNTIKDDELINELNNNPPRFIPAAQLSYKPEPKPKKEAQTIEGTKVYPRDKQIALNAIIRANFSCELDNSHKSFISRKTGEKYVEPHHLIPIAYQEGFENSLDVEANIVALCSNCHNEIHYGRDSGRLIESLYKQRHKELVSAGLDITLEDLLNLYKTN